MMRNGFSKNYQNILFCEPIQQLRSIQNRNANNTMKARRRAPAPVTPLQHKGVEYSAGQGIGMAKVQARDMQSNQILWTRKAYTTSYQKDLEADVQDVWITKIELQSDTVLKITDEWQKVHMMNLLDK